MKELLTRSTQIVTAGVSRDSASSISTWTITSSLLNLLTASQAKSLRKMRKRDMTISGWASLTREWTG